MHMLTLSVSPLSPVSWNSAPVVNGVQDTRHHNGLSSNGEPADPIMAFEGGEPFIMKAGPMKPQHVAGENIYRNKKPDERNLNGFRY